LIYLKVILEVNVSLIVFYDTLFYSIGEILSFYYIGEITINIIYQKYNNQKFLSFCILIIGSLLII